MRKLRLSVPKFKPSRLLLIVGWLGLQGAQPLNLNGEWGQPQEFRQSNFQPSPQIHPSPQLTQALSCPDDLQSLIFLMLRDLPNYANRVIQRARDFDRSVDTYSYVLIAGRQEFAPLTLGPGVYTAPTAIDPEPPQQVFFTTLERQYQENRAVETQYYHWLFLTKTPEGWRLAMMFTRFGSPSGRRPPTPPRESSNGVIGQAVKLWLRDCRAGVIRP